MQSIKLLDASQFRFCLLFGNGVDKPEYRALQRVPSALFCAKKGLLYMGFAQYSSPFCILDPLSHRRALPISSKKNFDSISQRMKKLSMMGRFLGAAVCSGNSLLVSREFTRRATVSVGNERGSCRFPLRPSCEKAAQPSPQAWLSCKIKMQFLELCAERI